MKATLCLQFQFNKTISLKILILILHLNGEIILHMKMVQKIKLKYIFN